jgi:phage baseplate assembly protein W
MAWTRGLAFAGLGAGAALGLATTAAGRLATVEDDAAVRQAILVLLSTTPGERVMRPAYGCPLHRLLFAPNDATTAGLAVHYVRQALRRFEPRVEIEALSAGSAPEAPSLLEVRLAYRVRASGRPGRLAFSLDLAGEAGMGGPR